MARSVLFAVLHMFARLVRMFARSRSEQRTVRRSRNLVRPFGSLREQNEQRTKRANQTYELFILSLN